MTEHPIVVIGDALVDVLRDRDAEESYVGGAALNVAVGIAILGHPVTLIAMIGDDENGARIRAEAARHGVELIPTISPYGTSVATSERVNGEPQYTFNEAAQNRRVNFGTRERAIIDAAPLVVISCFPFDDQEQSDALLEAVLIPQNRLLVDPNPRAGMLHDAALFRRNFEAVAAQALLVKIGDDDVELLHQDSLAEVRDRINRDGGRLVLATEGAAGATVQLENGATATLGIPEDPRPVVDTMGAGDACLAASASHLLRHGIPQDIDAATMMLQNCMAIAAATCRSRGALLQRPVS